MAHRCKYCDRKFRKMRHLFQHEKATHPVTRVCVTPRPADTMAAATRVSLSAMLRMMASMPDYPAWEGEEEG